MFWTTLIPMNYVYWARCALEETIQKKSERTLSAGSDPYTREKYNRHTQAGISYPSFYEPFPPLQLFGVILVICNAHLSRFSQHMYAKLAIDCNCSTDPFLCLALLQIYRPYRRIIMPHIPHLLSFAQFWLMQYSSYTTSLLPIPQNNSARSFVIRRTNNASLLFFVLMPSQT